MLQIVGHIAATYAIYSNNRIREFDETAPIEVYSGYLQ